MASLMLPPLGASTKRENRSNGKINCRTPTAVPGKNLDDSVILVFHFVGPCWVVFGLGFSEIVVPLWTDDIGDQAFWGLFTAM